MDVSTVKNWILKAEIKMDMTQWKKEFWVMLLGIEEGNPFILFDCLWGVFLLISVSLRLGYVVDVSVSVPYSFMWNCASTIETCMFFLFELIVPWDNKQDKFTCCLLTRNTFKRVRFNSLWIFQCWTQLASKRIFFSWTATLNYTKWVFNYHHGFLFLSLIEGGLRGGEPF